MLVMRGVSISHEAVRDARLGLTTDHVVQGRQHLVGNSDHEHQGESLVCSQITLVPSFGGLSNAIPLSKVPCLSRNPASGWE